MISSDDVRNRNDPNEELTEWFWDTVSELQKNPSSLDKLTDNELISFAEMMDVKTYFSHAPFYPPEDVHISENSLDRGGAWVISQGKEFFLKVWNQPELFWDILRKDETDQGYNFEFAAHNTWDERHGTDIPLP